MLSVHDGRRGASGGEVAGDGGVGNGGGREGAERLVSQMKLEPRGSCSTSVLYGHMWHLTSSVKFKRVL